MKRSIQKSGDSLVFVLPIEWVRANDIKKQSLVQFTKGPRGTLVAKPADFSVTRSVQKFGPSSYTVSLPQEWIASQRITDKNCIKIDMKRKTLHIRKAR